MNKFASECGKCIAAVPTPDSLFGDGPDLDSIKAAELGKSGKALSL